MGWTGHQTLVSRESCSIKVVQGSLLERLCLKDSVVSDELQDVQIFRVSSQKSIHSGSLSVWAFCSHRGISLGDVKSCFCTTYGKQIFNSKKPDSIIEKFESQDELIKNSRSLSSGTNYAVKTSSYSGVNMNSNFMCRTMFLMNDNLQNNARVLPKNVFNTPTESSPFVDPKCNFDSNSFCCGSNGLAFGDKHVVAKHPLSICGIPTAEEKPSVPQPPPPDPHLSEDKCLPKPKERPFSCEECGKSFLLKHHLTTHIRVHTGERPYVCSECGKSFAHKHCLVTHQRLHTGERPYTCLECKKSFTLKHHLVTHTRVHSRERPFACDECGRTFSQKRHLVTHSKLHTGERPFACDECGESFSQKEHLTTHSRFHGGERPYVCPDCGNAFQRKFQLVSHARLHGKRPYSCHSCGKEFLQKRTLVAHTRLHTGERPFSCQHCGEAFGRKCELAVHSRAAHTTGGRSFACRQCGNCFASREGLALHLRLHAGDICGVAFPTEGPAESRLAPAGEVSQPQKPHLCLQCGKSFAQKHGLVQHTKRHSGEKPHSCDKCGKSFAQKYSLSLHSRLHPPVEEPVSGPATMLHAPMMQHSSPALHSASPVVQHAPALRPPIQHSSPPTPSN